MSRLIDADALVEAMTKFSNVAGEDMTHAIFYTRIAPTMDAEPHWIPVSKRLPETYGEYIVTRKTEYGIKTKTSLYYENGIWWPPEEVIAWMPLPKPYEVKDEKTD